MKNVLPILRTHWRLLASIILGVVVVGGLLTYRLGSLTGGLAAGELSVAGAPLGWQGLYHQPLYLPLKIVQSIIFFFIADHNQLITRLPNMLFGLLSVITFAGLIRSFHGNRTTLLTVTLFATSSWFLHVSRLASYDVLYLWAVPLLLLGYSLRQRYEQSALVFYGSALSVSLLLFVPGLVWLIVPMIILSRHDILDGWAAHRAWWQRLMYGLLGLLWLPLLLPALVRSGAEFRLWLGLPAVFPALTTFGKQLGAVPIHLLIRGPAYPELWLGRLPILDVVTLAFVIAGGYFYARHWRAQRTRQLLLILIIGTILIGLGGPVGISLLIPVVFLSAAAGMNSLLKSWLRVFPHNPIARGLGIGLLSVAVAVSCTYNLRAYFVAWPHNVTTETVFHYRR
ncbi:MAG: hypothetical protein ABI602_02790 [Candidatus Saccharibacteria bacterium]